MNRVFRITLAISIGLLTFGVSLWLRLLHRIPVTDFDQIWIAARTVLQHRDPYLAVARGFPMPFYYPLPAAIAALPFALLPMQWAGPVFIGIGFALLSYGLLGRGAWTLASLLSLPAWHAAVICQWSPILTAAAVLPWLGWLAAAKPSTGAITTGAYFSRRRFGFNLLVGAALIGVSFAVWPGWLREWLDALRGTQHFVPLILRPGGALLLLSLLCWRVPEARLLALSAVIPQTGAPYDALVLALVPHRRVEALAFGLLSFVAMPFLITPSRSGDGFVRAVAHNQTVYLIALYLPALGLVLWRRYRVGLWKRGLEARADFRESSGALRD
jgi:hypothetical protein